MFEKAKPARDAFAFSLRGMRTVAAFTIAPVIADDRIDRLRDERSKQDRKTGDRKTPTWRFSRRRTAQDCP